MTRLARNPDQTVVPVDIFQTKVRNVAAAQRKTSQQHQDRAVAKAASRARIARGGYTNRLKS